MFRCSFCVFLIILLPKVGSKFVSNFWRNLKNSRQWLKSGYRFLFFIFHRRIQKLLIYMPANSAWILHQAAKGPCSGKYLQWDPSVLTRPLALKSSNSSRSNLVNPHFLETKIWKGIIVLELKNIHSFFKMISLLTWFLSDLT